MHPTLLIGLDGATYTILDVLMENGTMPFLKEFVDNGVRAELLSTANPLTPPAWTTLMTGRSPGHHGIIDFIWAEQRKTDHYFTLYNFGDIQCETIWSLVSRQQGTVCSLNFPLMAPPPAVSGYIVPGLVSWKHLRRNTHPQELFHELKELPGIDPKEFAWDFGLEKKAAKGVPPEEYGDWIDFHRIREKHWFAITKYILQKGSIDLGAILFDGMDKILHIGWRFLDPQIPTDALSPAEKKIKQFCLEYFRELDSFLEEIVAIAGPDCRVFIASDHGFGPAYDVLRINTWLHEQGYLFWKETDQMDTGSKEKVQRLVDQHFVLLDWHRTTAYARTTTSNGIYIKVAQNSDDSGVPEEQYENFRNGLIKKLLAITHPDTGQPVIKNVLTREEAYPGPNNGQAPDITIVMHDHSFISILNKSPVVCSRPLVEGTHYPQGVFIANGPGISKGKRLSQCSIIDVAPTLLYSLGVEVPVDMEGHLPAGIFEEKYAVENPLQMGPPTLNPDKALKEGADFMTDEEEKVIFDQLTALGYLE